MNFFAVTTTARPQSEGQYNSLYRIKQRYLIYFFSGQSYKHFMLVNYDS